MKFDKIKGIFLSVGIFVLLALFFYEELKHLIMGEDKERNEILSKARKAKAEKARTEKEDFNILVNIEENEEVTENK
jgi:hypothetical protein